MNTNHLIQIVRKGLVETHGYKDVMVTGVFHDQAIEFIGVKEDGEGYKGIARVSVGDIIINEYPAGKPEREGITDHIPLPI